MLDSLQRQLNAKSQMLCSTTRQELHSLRMACMSGLETSSFIKSIPINSMARHIPQMFLLTSIQTSH